MKSKILLWVAVKVSILDICLSCGVGLVNGGGESFIRLIYLNVFAEGLQSEPGRLGSAHG